MSGNTFSTRQKIRQELFISAPNAQEYFVGVASLFGSGQGYLGQVLTAMVLAEFLGKTIFRK